MRTSPIACKASSQWPARQGPPDRGRHQLRPCAKFAWPCSKPTSTSRSSRASSRNAKERCLTAEVLDSLTPAQNVMKIVLDELTELLGRTDSKLVLSSRIPNVIMLVGLQGSGKTTAAAKLAYPPEAGKGHSPLARGLRRVSPRCGRSAANARRRNRRSRVYRGDGQGPGENRKRGRSGSPSTTCATWSSSTRRVACTSTKR